MFKLILASFLIFVGVPCFLFAQESIPEDPVAEEPALQEQVIEKVETKEIRQSITLKDFWARLSQFDQGIANNQKAVDEYTSQKKEFISAWEPEFTSAGINWMDVTYLNAEENP